MVQIVHSVAGFNESNDHRHACCESSTHTKFFYGPPSRVKVVLSTDLKHSMPVTKDCAFSRRDAMVMTQDEDHICVRRDGLPMENLVSLER